MSDINITFERYEELRDAIYHKLFWDESVTGDEIEYIMNILHKHRESNIHTFLESSDGSLMKTNLQLLIERVREIDWYAAKFLEDNCSEIDEDCSEIIECFTWENTPQGHDYWEDLSKKLGEW